MLKQELQELEAIEKVIHDRQGSDLQGLKFEVGGLAHELTLGHVLMYYPLG